METSLLENINIDKLLSKTVKDDITNLYDVINKVCNDEEKNENKKYIRDVDKTLCVLRGGTQIFNYKNVENILKLSNVSFEHVYIGKHLGRPLTFGYVIFDSEDKLNDFLQNKCIFQNNNNGYIFNFGINREYLIFKRYKPNGSERSIQTSYTSAGDKIGSGLEDRKYKFDEVNSFTKPIRYITKLYIAGLPITNTHEVLHNFLNEKNIKYKIIEINNKYNSSLTLNSTSAKVYLYNDFKSKECVDNLELVQLIVNDSYVNNGIKYKDYNLIVKKYINYKFK